MALQAHAFLCLLLTVDATGSVQPDKGRARRIDALLEHAQPDFKEKCAAVFRGDGGASFSQAMQDWYLWHNIFSERLTWSDGAYIDIGSNNATFISNTLFFDKCLGWRGVCFEPQRMYHPGIMQHRSCKLVKQCVQGHAQSGRMLGKGGTAHFVQGGHKWPPEEFERSISAGSPLSHRDLPRTSRRNVLLPRGLGCAVAAEALMANGFPPGTEKIDLISIDIEGAEAGVLRCFPLDAYSVQAVLIEVNKHDRDALSLWFLRRGYMLEQTFLHSAPWERAEKTSVLDHLYVRRTKPAVYPPGMEGLFALDDGATGATPRDQDINASCSLFAAHVGHYCHRWRHWLPEFKDASTRLWRACAAEGAPGRRLDQVGYPY